MGDTKQAGLSGDLNELPYLGSLVLVRARFHFCTHVVRVRLSSEYEWGFSYHRHKYEKRKRHRKRLVPRGRYKYDKCKHTIVQAYDTRLSPFIVLCQVVSVLVRG